MKLRETKYAPFDLTDNIRYFDVYFTNEEIYKSSLEDATNCVIDQLQAMDNSLVFLTVDYFFAMNWSVLVFRRS